MSFLFSCCNEFYSYPKVPSRARNFWNNPDMHEVCLTVFEMAQYQRPSVIGPETMGDPPHQLLRMW